MKKKLLAGLILAGALLRVNAQSLSINSVDYMITYDASKSMYTAWLVPLYQTPNSNNADSEEKGITAQFSIKVPKGFEITKMVDKHGVWEKSPLKIGNQAIFANQGVDPNFEYYVIGKTPEETNFGVLSKYEPVALFDFQGTSANNSNVKVLDKNDSFVTFSWSKLSLNVQPSFYSKSGQKAKQASLPLEQFDKGISFEELKTIGSNSNSAGNGFISNLDPSKTSTSISVYPNPVESKLNIKFYATAPNEPAKISVLDPSGKILLSEHVTNVKAGTNIHQLNFNNLQAGNYYIKTEIGTTVFTNKVVK